MPFLLSFFEILKIERGGKFFTAQGADLINPSLCVSDDNIGYSAKTSR